LASGIVGESVDKGVVRFHASAAARDGALPSLCLKEPLIAEGKVPDGWNLVPEFNRVQGRTSVFLAIDEGTDLYGTGGAPYVGSVWPGRCVFPDFTMAQVREWWGGLYGQFLSLGIDGIWNDMNEPAVFNVDSKTMPRSNRHRADTELGGPGTHARWMSWSCWSTRARMDVRSVFCMKTTAMVTATAKAGTG